MKSLYAHRLVRHFEQSNQFYYIITDTIGYFKYANSLFIEKSGYTFEQLSSISLTYVIPEEETDKCNSVINKSIHQPEIILTTDMQCRRHDGSYFNICWELSVLLNKEDQPEGIQWIGIEKSPDKIETDNLAKTNEDIQKQYGTYDHNDEELWEVDFQIRHLIHNLNLGVILVNEKGEILIANQATNDMFGVTDDQLIGSNVLNTTRETIHEDGSPFPHSDFPIATVIRTKKSVKDIVMGISRTPGDDDKLWLLVSAEPVLDNNGNIRHIISSFTDVTELKRLSQQLAEQEIQKQKQLMQAIIDAQEKERREIGRELHDNISQHLTTTRLYLEVARDKAKGELLKMISQAHKGLLDIVNEIRQISESLVPPSLSDIGLIESIQDLCDPLKNIHAFSIDFHYHQFNEALLPDNMKLMVFRIIQEQINNIIRHANANAILIHLQTSKKQLTLSIADNGKGFNLATVKKGLGLDNISNRAGLFGGKLNIDTSPGRGCTIRVTIPFS